MLVDSSHVPQKSDIATVRLDKQYHINSMLKEAEFLLKSKRKSTRRHGVISKKRIFLGHDVLEGNA